ncbi:Coiled-coil domain-containing protein 25 [Rhizophlyctis rosea]|uniref:Coiled-coil domain-containing protein 25 n=1 Tax=Rhizophlyctis rosea TaxID=64517 RepID=A0AAD5WZU5_9FUNG|nr:Coiled-coil domain-containing protein 25 [Rhizophlyctis rosea]
MVYYFTSNVTGSSSMIYMGKDKFENEELIKYGWPEDVWFHVDKLSSAHVYLRLEKGQSWENISEDLLTDCAQLTKANSIEGNKKNNIVIIYTPWSNLKKTPGMETGQVTFVRPNMVKRVHVEKRINDVVNRLNKTREERTPDLSEEKIVREREERSVRREEEKKRKQEDLKVQAERKKEAEARSYGHVLNETKMKSNRAISESSGGRDVLDLEEDFM